MNPYGQSQPPPQAPPTPTTDPVAMMGKMFEIFRQMQPTPATRLFRSRSQLRLQLRFRVNRPIRWR